MKSFVSLIDSNPSRSALRLLGLEKLEFVEIPDLVFAEVPDDNWFWVLDNVSEYKTSILEGKSKLFVFWGLTECPIFPEDYTIISGIQMLLDEVRIRQPEIWKQQKFTLVLDKGLQNEDFSTLREYLQNQNIEVYFIPGFRNLVWGREECSVERTVAANILEGLESFGGKNFVPIRRPDDARKRLVQGILADSTLFSQSYVTYNMGFNGNKYLDCEDLQIAFNSQDPGFNQDDNGGSFVHEYNYYSVRKKLFTYTVCEHWKYLTEKSYKPMLLALPSFWLGSRGTVRDLQEQGFWTFNRWWNEDYDDLDYNDPEKVKKILDIIKSVFSMSSKDRQKMYLEMIPTFLHNGLVLASKSVEVENFIQCEIL